MIFSLDISPITVCLEGSSHNPLILSDDDSTESEDDGLSMPPATMVGPGLATDAPSSLARSPFQVVRDLQGLDELVKELAAQVWDCSR